MSIDQLAKLIVAALGGFYLGVAYADFVMTWRLKRRLSVDAFFLVALALLSFVTLAIIEGTHAFL